MFIKREEDRFSRVLKAYRATTNILVFFSGLYIHIFIREYLTEAETGGGINLLILQIFNSFLRRDNFI